METDRLEQFVQLLTQHELRLRAFVMSIVPNNFDADDVLQEGKLKVWKNFDQFEPGTSFMRWAGRIMYTTAMEHYKKQRRHKVFFSEKFVDAVASVAVDDAVVEDCGEREALLKECIDKLRPEHRDILRERYINQKKIPAIAIEFGRSTAGIVNVLSRIRRFLNDCVSKKLRQEATGA